MTRTELVDIPTVGDERELLMAFVDFQRTVLLRKVEGLTDEQARAVCPPSDLTLIGLIKHSIFVEHIWMVSRFLGEPMPAIWDDADWETNRDWELTSALDDSLDELIEQYKQAWARSNQIAAAADLDDLTAAVEPERGRFSLRWILLHLIEEYARHCGHADFIRQSIDGAVGD